MRVKIGLCALMGVGVMYVFYCRIILFSKLTITSACVCSILKTTLGLTALGDGEDLTCKLESISYFAAARFKSLIISKTTLPV